jgi:hypothetical protein
MSATSDPTATRRGSPLGLQAALELGHARLQLGRGDLAQAVQAVGRGGQGRDAVSQGSVGHGHSFGQVPGAIVHTGQDVAVQIR